MPRFQSFVCAALFLGLVAGSAQAGPTTPPADDIELGRSVYTQNCASCHGKDAEGAPVWQRPNELGELPAPPHDSDGHTWRHSDAELYEMIAKGWRDPFNRSAGLTMPAFEAQLMPEQIDAVVAYLKTLWTPEQQQFQRDKNEESLPPVEANPAN